MEIFKIQTLSKFAPDPLWLSQDYKEFFLCSLHFGDIFFKLKFVWEPLVLIMIPSTVGKRKIIQLIICTDTASLSFFQRIISCFYQQKNA